MSFEQLFGDSTEIKEQLQAFAGSMVDTVAVMHNNPRLLHTQANLGMSFFNQKDYLDMFYALDDSVPGNEYKWHERENFKVTLEFDGDWIPVIIHLTYDEEKMPMIKKYAAEKDLQIYVPAEKEQDENVRKIGIDGSHKGYFIVHGLFLYNVESVKEFMMVIDNQFHNFDWEG